MINPRCDMCFKELNDYGGLVFSPPDKKGMVKKKHICQVCYDQLTDFINEKADETSHTLTATKSKEVQNYYKQIENGELAIPKNIPKHIVDGIEKATNCLELKRKELGRQKKKVKK